MNSPRDYADELPAVTKPLIRFSKVDEPEQRRSISGSSLLVYAFGFVFSIASKDIVLEDMSE
jgi:hypothetical protein